MEIFLTTFVPPLSPPETGGELTKQDSSILKNFKQK